MSLLFFYTDSDKIYLVAAAAPNDTSAGLFQEYLSPKFDADQQILRDMPTIRPSFMENHSIWLYWFCGITRNGHTPRWPTILANWWRNANNTFVSARHRCDAVNIFACTVNHHEYRVCDIVCYVHCATRAIVLFDILQCADGVGHRA